MQSGGRKCTEHPPPRGCQQAGDPPLQAASPQRSPETSLAWSAVQPQGCFPPEKTCDTTRHDRPKHRLDLQAQKVRPDAEAYTKKLRPHGRGLFSWRMMHSTPSVRACFSSTARGHSYSQPTNLPYVRMTSPSLILVMAFLAISFAARVIRVLMNSLILSTMLAFASSSGRDGGDLAIIFLRALHAWSSR